MTIDLEAITAIPAEAIEAAAKAMHDVEGAGVARPWQDAQESRSREFYTEAARTALAAAAPLVRAPLVAEVKRLTEDNARLTAIVVAKDRLFHDAQAQAARMAAIVEAVKMLALVTTPALTEIIEAIRAQHHLVADGAYAHCSCGVGFSFADREIQHREHREERIAHASACSALSGAK